MTKEQVKDFLRERKGYLKEGGFRLAKKLKIKNIELCREAIREVNKELKISKLQKSKILIYDIETSPNVGWFWRAGFKQTISPDQIIKERGIICVSYKWLGEKEVYNLSWDKNQSDYFLVEQFIDVLNEADLIVAHNGDNFDIKWLRTRALFHGLHKNMLPVYKQFDTLKVAKSKLYLNSNRLDYISKFLGFEGKIKTSINLWLDIVYRNCRKALNEMLDYCDEDVRQLEKVYKELAFLTTPMYHQGVQNNNTKLTSPISGGSNLEHVKEVTSNRGTIKHIMKDLDNGRLFEMSDTSYKKYKQ